MAASDPLDNTQALPASASGDVIAGDKILGDKIGRDKIVIGSVATLVVQGSQVASAGLVALGELLANPEVQDAVGSFRAAFVIACDQIGQLSTFKDIHDLLHTLQFKCYNPISREARRFPGDEDVALSFADYELTMADIVASLHEIAARASDAAGEAGWIASLGQAHSELRAALAARNAEQLGKAIWLCRRVLAIQPTRINQRLNDAARALSLPTLIQALHEICDHASGKVADAEKLARLTAGVAAFESLDAQLGLLIVSHDGWQNVDNELRRIEDNLARDTQELELSWPLLEPDLEPLTAGDDTWAVRIRNDGALLAAALGNHDSAQARGAFLRYRQQASNQFFQVDVRLKRLCGELRLVGEPLEAILELLG